MKKAILVIVLVLALTVSGVAAYVMTYETEYVEQNLEIELEVNELNLLKNASDFTSMKMYEVNFTSPVQSLREWTAFDGEEEIAIKRIEDTFEEYDNSEYYEIYHSENPLFKYEKTMKYNNFDGKLLLGSVDFINDYHFETVEVEKGFFGLVDKKVTTNKINFVEKSYTEHKADAFINKPGDVVADIVGNTFKLDSVVPFNQPYKLYTNYEANQYEMYQYYWFNVSYSVDQMRVNHSSVYSGGDQICISGGGNYKGKVLDTLESKSVSGVGVDRVLLSCPANLNLDDYERLYLVMQTDIFEASEVRIPYHFNVK